MQLTFQFMDGTVTNYNTDDHSIDSHAFAEAGIALLGYKVLFDDLSNGLWMRAEYYDGFNLRKMEGVSNQVASWFQSVDFQLLDGEELDALLSMKIGDDIVLLRVNDKIQNIAKTKVWNDFFNGASSASATAALDTYEMMVEYLQVHAPLHSSEAFSGEDAIEKRAAELIGWDYGTIQKLLVSFGEPDSGDGRCEDDKSQDDAGEDDDLPGM
jgi:hypothetical protein